MLRHCGRRGDHGMAARYASRLERRSSRSIQRWRLRIRRKRRRKQSWMHCFTIRAAKTERLLAQLEAGLSGCLLGERERRPYLRPIKIIVRADHLWISSKFRWDDRRMIAWWTSNSTKRTWRGFPRSKRAKRRIAVCVLAHRNRTNC